METVRIGCAMFMGKIVYPFTSRTWIGRSGVSCFITNVPKGMYDAESINDSIEAAKSLMKGQEGCNH